MNLLNVTFFLPLLFGMNDSVREKSLTEWQNDIRYGQNILEAGRTSNPDLKVILEERLVELESDRRSADLLQISQLTLALARLGDEKRLREVYCSLYGERATVMSDITHSGLRYIGGWFAIRSSVEMLDSDKRFRRLAANEADDVSLQTPSMSALWNLKALLPDAPIQYSETKIWEAKTQKKYRQFWKEYVRKHEHELRKMFPYGSDAVFESCKAREK